MYIPKNRIQTDLYTDGSEYVYENTSNFYKGFYWKTFKGQAFAGKSPSDLPSYPLEKYIPSSFDPLNPQTPLQSKILISDEPSEFSDSSYNVSSVIEYTSLKTSPTALNDADSFLRYLPTTYYPTLSEGDYDIGTFTRYFVNKINEFIFIEINNDTFDNITNQNPRWLWQMYTPFTVDWVIKGEQEKVYKINKDTVLLIEQRLKKKGLQQYLKENYLKFWRP